MIKLTFIYKIPHGYFPGAAFFKYAPTVNASAWDANNLLVLIPPMSLQFPYILSKRRSEEGKRIRRLCKDDKSIPYQACKAYQLNQSSTCDTITTFCTDNNIIEMTDNHPATEYHPHPTKEDLLEYFGQRIRIRKMTPKEALRLQDVSDEDIDKIMTATETVTIKNGMAKTKKAISKTAIYRLAGNSIVTSCLFHIFRTLFIPGQPENKRPIQRNLFDFED